MIEYKLLQVTKTLQDELNSLSKEGWKVVCSFGRKGDLILKRKLDIRE